MNPRYSVVVPCYNDSAIVAGTFAQLKAAMDALGAPYELVFIDDGSSDGTFEALKRLQSSSAVPVTLVKLWRNFGQHAAIFAGFEKVRGDVIVTIDSDLETPASEIRKLVDKLSEGYDVVSGWRQSREPSAVRALGSRTVNWLMQRAFRIPLRDYGSMLRAHTRETVQLIREFPEPTKVLFALLSWLDLRIAEVPVECKPSEGKTRSRYSVYKLAQLALDVLIGYTTLPMLLVALLGILCCLLGFVSGLFLLVYRFLYGPGRSGLVTFLALLSSFGGLQLLALGLIGQYISRIYTDVRHRPFYLVKEVIEPATRRL